MTLVSQSVMYSNAVLPLTTCQSYTYECANVYCMYMKLVKTTIDTYIVQVHSMHSKVKPCTKVWCIKGTGLYIIKV